MEKYIIIALSVLVVILVIAFAVLFSAYRKLKFGGIKIKKGVRYTTDEIIEKNNKTNVTYNEKDIVLEVNKEYVVGDKKFLPGTYTLLSSNETYNKFNIRISGMVREYKHGEKVVLSKGDTITAVSNIVILR